MIPIKVSIVVILIAIIAAVYFMQLKTPGFTEQFYFNPSSPNPWMFVTSIFLHDPVNFAHVLFNSYGLFMFGMILENKIGRIDFLKLFFLAGIAGNVLYLIAIMLGVIDPYPALGASGAIYGILGALAVLMPELVIYLYLFPVPIRIAAVLWVLVETFGVFGASSGIANAAHLGGLFFGIAFGLYYRGRMQVPKDPFANL